ncbi:MAG TPA: hypothetical protein VL404_00950, partial [Candidatus Eisenbacteria bacterium]|nr:hypothetical protein [Candidatus Eisenbacteria bacterium]
LGPTGRNFAAGMSGGLAYVYDAAGDFDRHCNKQMVETGRLADCASEVAGVKKMIERHAELTGSTRAREILARWNETLPKFVRVIPKDYKRVLQCLEKVQSAGLTGEEAIMAAFQENVRDLARVGGN